MPEPEPVDPTGTCLACGATFQRSKTELTRSQATVYKRKYCAGCRQKNSYGARRRKYVDPDTGAKRDPATFIEGALTELRLRVEAAKPLLRIAIARGDWPLVDAALAELEQTPRPAVIDLRAHTGINA